MSDINAVIFGASGLELTEAERAFYREANPWGFILFARNISADAEQIKRLVADMRDSVGRDCPRFDRSGRRPRPAHPRALVPALSLRPRSRRHLAAGSGKGVRAAW